MASAPDQGFEIDLMAAVGLLVHRWALLLGLSFIGACLAYGVSYAIKPTFQSANTFLPPQQQQSGSAAALASLGALSGLVGGAGIKTSADQYVALMQSVTVSDRLIDKFKLQEVYDERFKVDARNKLLKRVQISVGKKDGLIRVEVEDTDPSRAAAMANQYVEELRLMTTRLAVTEAQQRRVFFDKMLQDTKAKLVEAQIRLEGSGFNAGAIKAEPRSAAEGFAKLQADLTLAKVQLQVMRSRLADNAVEVQQQLATVRALSEQVSRIENSQPNTPDGQNYIAKYREYRYQETLFEMFAKQYELARVDESREGTLIQVVDTAMPAEKKFSPRRLYWAVAGSVLFFLISVVAILFRKRQAIIQFNAT